MGSSVIKQSSYGLATETQSGLVSTEAQTLGGDKTLAGSKVVVNGNIGVGTVTPTAKLDVNGAVIIGPTTGNVTHVFRSAATTLPSNLANATCHFTNKNAGAVAANAGWVAASFGAQNKAADAIVIGSADGRTYIAGHNSDLSAWSSFNIRGTSGVHQFSTAGALQWRFGGEVDSASSTAFIVYNAGGVGVYVSPGATSWTANSDERMKKNIKPLELGLEQINALKPAQFDYNTDESEGSSRVGFIAQEVLPVLPHAVVVPEDSEKMMGVSSTEMIPVLVKAIQELSAKNDALEARLAVLEASNG